MQNVNNSVVAAAVAAVATQIEGQVEAGHTVETDAAVAVLEAPAATDTIMEAATEEAQTVEVQTPDTADAPVTPGTTEGGPTEGQTVPQEAKAVDPLAELATLIEGKSAVEYSRAELMDARTFTLMVKRAAKQNGFGEKSGPFIRDTVGYKFDSMDIMEVLKGMATPDFLDRYKATCERWLKGVKSDDSDTGKANKRKFEAAMALFGDRVAYAKLVKSLLVLCQRNQSWMETGSNLNLPYNGHKAVLDLFGINVTTNRRLKLVAQ